MQRSKHLVRSHRSTTAEEGAATSGCEDVPGSCSSDSYDESYSSEEDQVVYLHGMRVLQSAAPPLDPILEDIDDDADNTLEEIGNRHGEELERLYAEMMDEIAISRAIHGLSPPFKTYIEHLRENNRFINEPKPYT